MSKMQLVRKIKLTWVLRAFPRQRKRVLSYGRCKSSLLANSLAALEKGCPFHPEETGVDLNLPILQLPLIYSGTTTIWRSLRCYSSIPCLLLLPLLSAYSYGRFRLPLQTLEGPEASILQSFNPPPKLIIEHQTIPKTSTYVLHSVPNPLQVTNPPQTQSQQESNPHLYQTSRSLCSTTSTAHHPSSYRFTISPSAAAASCKQGCGRLTAI